MEEGTNELDAGYEGTPAEKPVEEKPVIEEVKAVEPETQEPAPYPLKEIKAQFEQFERRIRNAEGHIGGLNHNQKLLQETLAASREAKATEKPSQQQVKEAMTNPKEWDELKADYPEWAVATEKLLESKLGSAKADIDIGALQREVAQRVRFETEASVRKEIISSSLNAVFPEWEDEVRKPEFGKWLESQTEDIRNLAGSNRVGDAARLLKLYDARKPVSKPNTRQELIKAAITPKGNGGSPVNRTEIDDFEAGYNSR